MKTFTNFTAGAVGLYGTDAALKVATPMSGAALSIEPDHASLQVMEIYEAAGLGNLQHVGEPKNTVAPAVTGTARVGQVLTSTTGTWTGDPTPTFTRQWQFSENGTSGWMPIGIAKSATYTLTEDDLDFYVRCLVTGSNSKGSVVVNSNAIGPILA